ncbi:MAG: zinc-binding dehydrogenase [Candidatus Lokiarchaeota archaeon]|nr:zinc-binding dehydrogenase [Candidatus Lokiarchaeota archaeon]MBD3340098.1 zinc-binding dehydrogenase [Candidatus Lokiarchaeota archaeon]
MPLIMGHEFSGEIVQVGEDIKDFEVGDKVVGVNVLLDLNEGELDGLGIFRNGGFAEFVEVPEKYLFKIPESISTKEAALIESFANAARGTRLSKIDTSEKIAIIGGGNIGLCFMNYLMRKKDPDYIIVIEPHKFLREKAKEMGATDSFPPSKVKLRKFFKKHGDPTFIFDCAGNEKSLTMAINLITRGGTVLLEGVHRGSISFPMFLINSKEVCLKGCLGHDRDDILNAIDFFEKSDFDADQLISDVIPLKDIEKAFNRCLEPGERNFIKILVKVNEV